MDAGVVQIGWIELICSAVLMIAAGIVSWKFELGQEKRIAISTFRCFLQLLACGLLLGYLFQFQTWWLVLLVLAGMVLAATQIAGDRVKSSVSGLTLPLFLSIGVSSMVMLALVSQAIIHVEPWYSGRTLVPIGGMFIGNAMSSTAVAIDRLFADMDAREDEILTLLALGASPREAAFSSIRASIAAGLTPTLATMSAAGIVTIPGMMTGQILAGADPTDAAKYQIVILVAISFAQIVAIMMACYLVYKKRFGTEGYYLRRSLRSEGREVAHRGKK